jgi:MerR family mercuric resistance operon transcriptional regulator
MSSLSIGRLSDETGVNIETIRYYERIGLTPKPARSEGGRRFYDARDAERLKFVRRCRELGFYLADIRSLIALSTGGAGCDAEVKALTLAHLGDISAKLADLARLRASLEALATSCRPGAQDACPILAALGAPDAAGEEASVSRKG